MTISTSIPSGVRAPDHGSASVRYWGARGSIPVPGSQTAKYGGNTSCVEVRADGQIIVFDAGTGLRPLGAALGAEFRGRTLELTMLMTHFHWDHVQGFPFFAPAFDSRNRIRVLGFPDAGCGLREAFERQMEAPFFPVALAELPGGIVFEELGGGAFEIGGIRASACRSNHPGTCHGYRLDTGAGSICYVPDHDAGAAGEGQGIAPWIHGADLLILDAQYTAEEYRAHPGWGHSAMEDAVRLACEARVKRLHLFHHDPLHDDDFLEQLLQKAKRIAAGSGTSVELAREGGHVSLRAKA